ncbi:MAG: OmpA family protein, partial [Gemmatimonadaceae bacterium]
VRARVTGALVILLAAPVASMAQVVRLPPPTVTYTPGERGKVTGLIVSRDGNDLLVRDETTNKVSTVTITEETNISSPTGFLSLEREPQPATTLIRGLIIAVSGTGGSRGSLVAKKISFHKSALRVAEQISAGEVELRARERETAALAAANRDRIAQATLRARDSLDVLNARISRIDSYVLRVRGTVNFASGSARLSEEARLILDDLVAKSRGLDGYVIEVAGYTDSGGSLEETQELSERRAGAVVAYLNMAHDVPLRRIASPTGLGASRPVASNDTPGGRALNRRVEIRVLVSRGLR